MASADDAYSVVLTDGVVALTLHSDEDAAILVEFDRDPEHRRRFGVPDGFVPSEAHARTVLSRWQRERKAGERYPFAVRDAQTSELLGGCELLPAAGNVASASYWTHPAHRGRGVARRALGLLMTVASRNFDFDRLEILTHPDNLASKRVAERGGFVVSGTRDGKVVHTAAIVRGGT